jgi:hypothetical protein
MIKMPTAYTAEIDDADVAVAEILEQLAGEQDSNHHDFVDRME